MKKGIVTLLKKFLFLNLSAPLRLLARPWPYGLRYGCARIFNP